MKLRITFLITAIIMVVLTNVNDIISYGTTKWNVFDSMLQETNGKVVECEVQTSFELPNDKESDLCLELLKEIYSANGTGANINVMKDEPNYSIEFQNGNISGYLESNDYKDHSIITIDIRQKCGKNEIENINNIIDFAIHKVDINRNIGLSNKQTFKFIKAEMPITDIHLVNNKVIKLLEKHNSVNVNTIDINNGFSTVAYTGSGEYIINHGEKMDLNYAICKYSSGNYLVIGTPIIITAY